MMKALCPECGGKGGHLLYEPGLFNVSCMMCKGTGYVTVTMPDTKNDRRYKRYDKVCRKCGKIVGGCFSGPGLPEPRVDSRAICPWCPLGTEYNIELVLAEESR